MSFPNRYLLPLILSLLFVGILLSVLVNQQRQISLLQSHLLSPTPVLSPQPTLTAKASAAAVWQTYKNDKYGFEFQYPQNFFINENRESVEIFSSPCSCETDHNGKTEKISASSVKVSIKTHTGKSDPSYESYDRTSVIGGKTAKCYFSGAESAYGTESCLVEVSPNKFFEVVSYTPVLIYRCEDCQRQNNPLNITSAQILSTFKFTTPKPTSSIAPKWQTYKNDDVGYEFSYPSNLNIEEKISPNRMIIVWQDKNHPTQPLQHFNPAAYFQITSEHWAGPVEDWAKDHAIPGTGKAVKIGDQSAYYFNGDGPGEGTFNYVFKRSSTIVRVVTLESKKTIEKDPTFSQILSTFKFID